MIKMLLQSIAILSLAGISITSCDEDSTRPVEDKTAVFTGILETNDACTVIGGDTSDFLPRPEGSIDTTVVPPIVGPPTNHALIGACPNPSIIGTSIHWQIPEPDSVWILAFDKPGGAAIDTLVRHRGRAGAYSILWQPAVPGFYRIRMYTESGFESYGDVLIEP